MNIGEIINEEVRNFVMEEEYFSPKLSADAKRNSKKFVGKNVIWYGNPDQMIVVPAENVHGMWGNIYDPQKLEYVKDLIINSEEPVEFECSYGIGDIVELIDIKEHQESAQGDSFEIDYEGHNRPYSTGDVELDKYIGTEYMCDQDFTYMVTSDPNVLDFFEKHKYDLINGKETVESLEKEFNSLKPDEDEYAAFEEFINLEENLVEAFKNKTGDIGKFEVQLRDGHHRVMGAIDAGEDYICVNLEKDQIPRFQKYINMV